MTLSHVPPVDAAAELDAVLAHYPPPFRACETIYLAGAGGLSGARLWKIKTAVGTFCLRRWPSERPEPARLRFIHAVIRHVAAAGFSLTPLPLPTLAGETFVQHHGYPWQLEPWMPGEIDPQQPICLPRLRSAMTALARFHRAAETFPLQPAGGTTARAASPGLAERLQLAAGWGAGGVEKLAAARLPEGWPELAAMLPVAVEVFCRHWRGTASQLESCRSLAVPLQPCLRDIWRENVLFQGNDVSGIVDLGAMRPESVAADVARLLASLAGEDRSLWDAGIEAYSHERPLRDEEMQLIGAFDRSARLLTLLTWFSWLVIEERQFPDRDKVVVRLDEAMRRMTRLDNLL